MTDFVRYKLGKTPARPGAVKMLFRSYASAALPKPPDEFGHESLITDWGMLGNADYGDCAWAGAGHETMLWTAEAGSRVRITTQDVLDDYGAVTGFDPRKPESDQGTDMQAAAAYRQKTGIRDALDQRHKIGAYAALSPGYLDELKTAVWLFGAVGLGLIVGDTQQEQFAAGKPWDGAPGSNSGGHYVPICAFRNGLFYVVTWGKLQAITPTFLQSQNDESIAYFSTDFLTGGKSLDGFDSAALQDDLTHLTA